MTVNTFRELGHKADMLKLLLLLYLLTKVLCK